MCMFRYVWMFVEFNIVSLKHEIEFESINCSMSPVLQLYMLYDNRWNSNQTAKINLSTGLKKIFLCCFVIFFFFFEIKNLFCGNQQTKYYLLFLCVKHMMMMLCRFTSKKLNNVFKQNSIYFMELSIFWIGNVHWIELVAIGRIATLMSYVNDYLSTFYFSILGGTEEWKKHDEGAIFIRFLSQPAEKKKLI